MALEIATTKPRRKSIAEARDGVADLVHQVEEESPGAITRRGRIVAVLISAGDSERLAARRPDLWEVIRDLRECVVHEGLERDDADWEGLRGRRPCRDVDLS